MFVSNWRNPAAPKLIDSPPSHAPAYCSCCGSSNHVCLVCHSNSSSGPIQGSRRFCDLSAQESSMVLELRSSSMLARGGAFRVSVVDCGEVRIGGEIPSHHPRTETGRDANKGQLHSTMSFLYRGSRIHDGKIQDKSAFVSKQLRYLGACDARCPALRNSVMISR